ncbi:40S ribosomal protein S2 [Aspergillus costaricaensis CBS 115574]|uniref:40S ribosomal protein S2 n=1 Tax=Aspergillus costaricaensis CBS 115574 TaxID=1448317 RepID=A0ACD1IEC4_9EURO|nr:40S ribosomal protein S2 [Aspergillus costaricaensis CBS 115574]RAK88132.1 40S ribosomal protein S2 [Aspergillus costaricaensis CBS 115574]
MIVRQLVRQSRQLRALPRQSRILSRFSSTETTGQTPVQTIVAEQAPQLETPAPAVAVPEPGTSGAQEKLDPNTLRRIKFHSLGSDVTGVYRPESLLKNPPKATDVTLEMLLANQTHLGHSTSRWNPQNSRYIFGIREGTHIISLDITAAYLRRAAKIVEEVAFRGGLVLFAGTRKGQKRAVVRAAELAQGYHIFERWIPGSLTNGQQILGHCDKKIVNGLDETIEDLWKEELEGYRALKPDLVVCLNPVENVVLLHECGLNNVPTIGIIDTDADPTRVTYPIPANDDSLRSVTLIAGVLGRAGEAGQQRRLALARKGEWTYKLMQPLRQQVEETTLETAEGQTPEASQDVVSEEVPSEGSPLDKPKEGASKDDE